MTKLASQPDSAEAIAKLADEFANNPQLLACIESLQQKQPATFDSVWGSSCALLIQSLARSIEQVVVVVGDAKSQDRLIDDLPTFGDASTERFPACMIRADNSNVVDLDYGERLRVVKSLSAGDPNPIIVATVPSLLQPVPSANSLGGNTRRLVVGDQMDVNSFLDWLLEHGFHSTSAVELPGEFSNRGGILDVFAPDFSSPVRIELFDNEIESLRQFDTGSQRSVADLNQFEITVLTDRESANFEGHLFDHIAEDAIVLLVEPDSLEAEANRFLERTSDSIKLFTWDETRKKIAGHGQASASAVTTGMLGEQWQLPVESVEKFSGEIGEIRMQVERLARDATGQDYHVHVLASVDGEMARVNEIFSSTAAWKDGRISLGVGCAHEGFRVRDQHRVIVSCDQIFNRSDLRRKGNRRLGKAIDSFLDLKDGNLIVHLSHGIGRYRGLKMLEKDGQTTEHMELEFHGGTRLYVPAAKIDLVQKYIGGTKRSPTLAKIGGTGWQKRKASVESAITDMASEMIDLQAQRQGRSGIAMRMDTQWQSEFEQSFPYHETPDQLTAIASIKEDLESSQPMDRLLCGDVGYGKTEVSMRAAFQAVENGYQVGVLVPTTVLAEQHYKSFKARMAEFPLEIVKLSRFCTRQEMKENMAKLKSGSADIAIGTHRLVSKGMEFKNLGLVVIDEEQKFGVKVKEKLKNFRSTVNILTMSATPIPRTLHMSLVGVRDISNLETPPEDRIPVETKVTRFSDEIVRNGILREISRGGQVFFVHNRVKDIYILKDKIKSIVPEATIEVGHGQMDELELEKVMSDFILGKFDVLLATTIVESGLDIPNANTIFIDEADRYGLSDLHQLRGRVGRYKNQAYCYLLLQPHKHLNPTAAKRLQAIETFSQMGAGFQISMRDLEIRGAGNLLGTQQSGHIATVGYEMYCQLLEKAVRQLKSMPQRMTIQVDVDLPIAAYVPDEYVPDRRQKLDLYRRLTRLDQFDQINEIESELKDRFGPLPKSVMRLLALSEVKLLAASWLIDAIQLRDKYLCFEFADRGRIERLSKERAMVRIIDDNTAMVTLKSGKIAPMKLLNLVKSLLQSV
jgi:transcription-repair coupling factor (superfamily II helicase)